ncbi:MAG: hypothetical protein ACYCW6_11295 [Candidatus Xenobia bacterium]
MFRQDILAQGFIEILHKVNVPGVGLEELAYDVLCFMVDLFEAQRGEIVVFQEGATSHRDPTEDSSVRFRLHYGYSAEDYQALREAGILAKSMRHSLLEKKSRVVEDTSKEEQGVELDLSKRLRNGSWMNHVLELNGEVLAYIHLGHEEKGRFTKKDLDALIDASIILATVLNISRLRERQVDPPVQSLRD